MAKIISTSNGIYSKHKREAGLFVAAIIFFFTIFSGLCPYTAEAKEYFSGKNSVVFIENTADFVNEAILIGIVDDLKKQGGISKIDLVIMCTEMVTKQDNSTKLSDLRIAVLKRYFQTKLPGSQVDGFGQTLQQPNIKLNDNKQIGNVGPDLLKISATVTNTVASGGDTKHEPSSKKPLEPWRLELLERYKKVEENHRTLCEQPFPMSSQECQNILKGEICGAKKEIGDINHAICKIKHLNCVVINRSQNIYDDNQNNVSLKNAEYDLERIEKIKETAGEVFAIAKEIQAHTGKPISYDSRIIDDEIKFQKLGIRYLRRAVQKAAIAIADLSTQPNSYSGNSRASHLYPVYKSWIIYDGKAGTLYLYKTRKLTIEYLRELHNYVRLDLHLPLLDYTGSKPFCVFTEVYSLNITLENNDFWYNSEVKPLLLEFGIQEIPLE